MLNTVFLLDENRKGEISQEIQADVKNDFDLSSSSINNNNGMLGKKIGRSVFTGFPKETIMKEALRKSGCPVFNTSWRLPAKIKAEYPGSPFDLETALEVWQCQRERR